VREGERKREQENEKSAWRACVWQRMRGGCHAYEVQHKAAHCNVLQQLHHAATRCNTLHHAAPVLASSSAGKSAATQWKTHIATYCNTHHNTTHRNILQHTSQHSAAYALQHPASHCNTVHPTHQRRHPGARVKACPAAPTMYPRLQSKFRATV